MSILLTLLAALTLLPGRSLAAPAAPVCPGGRFLVVAEPGSPPLVGAGTEPEVIAIQGLETPPGIVVISSGCGRVIANVKLSKRGALLKAAWPSGGCRGEDAIRLKATIDTNCRVSGTIKKKKQKPRKFTAALSTCGDGVVDAQTEECEPAAGCQGGRACGGDCRCVRPTTTTLARPPVSTLPVIQSTTTSTSTTATGGQASSTVTTSSTSTTVQAGGSCGEAAAPMCTAECGSGIVCTNALCADPDQACFDDEDCDAGFCVLFGDFGICAVDESCGAEDESCASGLCVSYTSCFCWYP